MSGKPWSEERKAAFSKQQKLRWRDPALRKAAAERGRRIMADPVKRAAKSALMKDLNVRMRDNDELKRKCVRGQKRVRRQPAYRAIQSAVMKDLMSRPENKRAARLHCQRINRNPKVRRRQVAGRWRKAVARKEPS